MMKSQFSKILLATLAVLVFQVSGSATAEPATKEEAVTFVKKAMAFVKQNGKEKAMSEFNNPSGQFVDRELYIAVIDFDGVVLANGRNPKMVGKSIIDIRDANGRYFTKEQVELAKTKGKGWVEFEWVNPVSQKMEPRAAYLERMEDYFVAAGVYRSSAGK